MTKISKVRPDKKLLAFTFAILCLPVFAEDKWASTDVNVRTGPGASFAVMGQLRTNEKVEIFNIASGWAQILFENVEGYVSDSLLLSERPQTPAEQETARIEKERRQAETEKEKAKAKRLHILIVIGGIIGTFVILKFRQ